MADARKIYVPNHVLLREVGGETVLLNLETEKYFGLDEVGTAIFRELRPGSTIDEAIEVLLAEWDVEAERLRSDVVELLESLQERGLVRIDG